MQIAWCWQCKSEVPMLDEAEWSRAHAVFMQSLSAQKAEDYDRFHPAFDQLRSILAEIHGMPPTNPYLPFWHKHRIAHFGPPCQHCGKVLRTPRASTCFECGHARQLLP